LRCFKGKALAQISKRRFNFPATEKLQNFPAAKPLNQQIVSNSKHRVKK
jgi:hypothetical protein